MKSIQVATSLETTRERSVTCNSTRFVFMKTTRSDLQPVALFFAPESSPHVMTMTGRAEAAEDTFRKKLFGRS